METPQINAIHFERFVSYIFFNELVEETPTYTYVHIELLATCDMSESVKTKREHHCYANVGLCSQSLLNHGRTQD